MTDTEAPTPDMVASEQFRAAMARLGAAVNIITTDGPDGRLGMTASAVCSVTDQPASLLVCVNRSARLCAPIEQRRALCINVLNAEHQSLAGLFASRGKAMADRFAGAEWETLANGMPALVGALCNLSCRVKDVHMVGSHHVFFCRVEEVRVNDGDGLVYFNRGYHRLPMNAAA